MQSASSVDTWISIDARPPPVSRMVRDDSMRLLCEFQLSVTGEIALGYYLGEGELYILGRDERRPGLLDAITHWRPFNPEKLQEFERRA